MNAKKLSSIVVVVFVLATAFLTRIPDIGPILAKLAGLIGIIVALLAIWYRNAMVKQIKQDYKEEIEMKQELQKIIQEQQAQTTTSTPASAATPKPQVRPTRTTSRSNLRSKLP
ncbi:MAG: hypothetical protein HXX08_25055 [Chloroflexi bacterium]|uniref:Uncharacterized protein n=1 Tax=Candidatus Chlorohelix allophototropha TaxID=3003348 RepID=A0A8T7MAF6_9CHLR|nr:hypothetical protein [Chloroflexota bacterium]WJW70449.1 hypothetical protein OZ401_005085 [Chloroflexota bacterium L227-S17]